MRPNKYLMWPNSRSKPTTPISKQLEHYAERECNDLQTALTLNVTEHSTNKKIFNALPGKLVFLFL